MEAFWTYIGHVFDTWIIWIGLNWCISWFSCACCCCGYRLSRLKMVRDGWRRYVDTSMLPGSSCSSTSSRSRPASRHRRGRMNANEFNEGSTMFNASNSRISMNLLWSSLIDLSRCLISRWAKDWSVDHDITQMKLYHFVCCKFGSKDMPKTCGSRGCTRRRRRKRQRPPAFQSIPISLAVTFHHYQSLHNSSNMFFYIWVCLKMLG